MSTVTIRDALREDENFLIGKLPEKPPPRPN